MSEQSGETTQPQPQPSSAPHKSLPNKILRLINESHVRFAWFLGNLTVISNTVLYLFTYNSERIFNSIWYRTALLGSFGTFAVVLYQNQKQFFKSDNSFNIHAFLQDDNVHYLYDALIWLLIPQKYTLAIIPFASFSIFHIANFVGNEVLPALGLLKGLSSGLKSFTIKYHESSRRIAAGAELLLLLGLIFDSLLLRKYSWISLILYSVFIKLKTETSIFTKSILKNWEVRFDGLFSLQSVPPSVKTGWIGFKRGLKKINQYSLVNKIESEAPKTN